ncbi:AAA family ATPase, partial [Candidatus Poribacteria bacterium]|nr:AAA family ATPase [Candidatus Poribacteria bacterium]
MDSKELDGLIGQGHAELIEWLTKTWLPQGPPICVVEGFPGIGKTSVARILMNLVEIPAVMITVPDTETDPTDDILLDLAMELSLGGNDELADAVDQGNSLPMALTQILLKPTLIIIDEFQRVMTGESGMPVKSFATVFDRLANRQQLKGRILLLSNRTVERGRWSEPYTIRTLPGLEADEAEHLLDKLLTDAGREDEVPVERRKDVVNWMGRNPRAIRLLVASLARDSLDDLIGLSPEIWEVRDREVSAEFIYRLERELLQRTLGRLSDEFNRQLRRLGVHRKTFKRQAIEPLFAEKAEYARFKNELIDRFLMEQHKGWFALHPIVREIGLQRLKETPSELQGAHGIAARYYTRHFRAKETKGWGKLGGHFVEARYHLVNAGREEDLREIVVRFENHVRATLKGTSPIPSSANEISERIAVLSALLETPGAKGLEYHLARLFRARGRAEDLQRAIVHAKRAIGPQSPADGWVLCGQLLAQAGRVNEAIDLLNDGINKVPVNQSVSLYQSCGQLLAQAGRVD